MGSNDRKDAVLQTGAQKHHQSLRSGSSLVVPAAQAQIAFALERHYETAVVVTTGSFMVVCHLARRVTCLGQRATAFQAAKHGYLTDHTNSVPKLTTPTFYILANFKLAVCF